VLEKLPEAAKNGERSYTEFKFPPIFKYPKPLVTVSSWNVAALVAFESLSGCVAETRLTVMSMPVLLQATVEFPELVMDDGVPPV
jgi:hypothetical protein